MRFIQQNWIQLAVSLLLFVNVEIFNYASKAVDLYQIASNLFDANGLVQQEAEL